MMPPEPGEDLAQPRWAALLMAATMEAEDGPRVEGVFAFEADGRPLILQRQRRGAGSANIAKLQVFHRHSNQAEVSGGCPLPWGFFVNGQARKRPTPLLLLFQNSILNLVEQPDKQKQ